MRPCPNEVIAGVREILKREISPHLPDYAQPHLKRIMAVLRDGRWDDAAFDVLHENAQFADLARVCAARIDSAGEQPEALEACAHALRAAAEFGAPASFTEANSINRTLRGALVGCLEAIRDNRLVALDDLGDDLGDQIGARLLAVNSQ